MPRVKRGVQASKRRKNVLKKAKGYRLERHKKYRAAKQARIKAESYATRDRKVRKRAVRQLWIVRLNAACRKHDLKYSEFMSLLKKNKIELDRKILADIAIKEPKTFKAIVDQVKPKK
ncbi:MAG: 50S ribosomal protein L20 [bacterium]